jgi:hypothetical protein
MNETPADVESLISQITGRVILGGGLDEGYEGFHLKLDDGRVLIITGMFAVGVYRHTTETLQ